MAQTNIDIPPELKEKMKTWGKNHVPKYSLTHIVVTACQEWVERNIPENSAEAERLAQLEALKDKFEREIAALKEGNSH